MLEFLRYLKKQKLSTLVLGIPKALSTWVPTKDFHKMSEHRRGHCSTIAIALDLLIWIEPAMLVIFRTFHYLPCEVEHKIQQQLEWGRLYYDGSHGINQVVYKSSLIFLLLEEYRSAMHFDGKKFRIHIFYISCWWSYLENMQLGLILAG